MDPYLNLSISKPRERNFQVGLGIDMLRGATAEVGYRKGIFEIDAFAAGGQYGLVAPNSLNVGGAAALNFPVGQIKDQKFFVGPRISAFENINFSGEDSRLLSFGAQGLMEFGKAGFLKLTAGAARSWGGQSGFAPEIGLSVGFRF